MPVGPVLDAPEAWPGGPIAFVGRRGLCSRPVPSQVAVPVSIAAAPSALVAVMRVG